MTTWIDAPTDWSSQPMREIHDLREQLNEAVQRAELLESQIACLISQFPPGELRDCVAGFFDPPREY